MKFEVGKVYNNKLVLQRKESLTLSGDGLDVQISFDDGDVRTISTDEQGEYYEEKVTMPVKFRPLVDEEPTEEEKGEN